MFEWGWVVEPDPDYQLSTFTCDQRSSKDGGTIFAGLSDSFFCNEEYDQLYAEQALETDPAKRAEIVRAMQQILYDEAPYVVTFYYDQLQAYRSDSSTNFTRSRARTPVPLLFQFGTWSYRSRSPPAGADGRPATESSTGTGVSPALIAGLGALVAAGIAAVAAGRTSPVIGRGHRVGTGDPPWMRRPPRRPRSPTRVAARRSPGLSPGTAATRCGRSAPGSRTLVFVLVFNFFLFRMLPGDPIGLYTRGRNVRARADRRVARASSTSRSSSSS